MVIFRVNSKGMLISMKGGERNGITYNHDITGRLTGIVMDATNTIGIGYDEQGNIQPLASNESVQLVIE